MRIYVFTEHYPNTYKPYFDTQFGQLLSDGHEVRVFAFGKFEGAPHAKALAWGLHGRTRYCPWTLRSLPAFAPAVLGHLPRVRARVLGEVVRRQAPGRGLTGALLDLARAALLPERPPDLCLIHNLVTAQAFGFLKRVYPRAPVALYFHGGEIPGGGTISDAEARRAFERADRVFTNTRFSAAQAVQRGCPPRKVVVCPVGFDLSAYRPARPRRYREGGHLRLLSVGRVSEEKGLSYALDAVARLVQRGHRELSYRVVGRGPALGRLRDRVAREGLGPYVEIPGELPHHVLGAEYGRADVLLLPSVVTGTWAETQACVVQEAMLMELPVVATRTGGVLEALAPELHPLSVPERDAEALASTLERVLRMGALELRQLGTAGRRFARARFDVRRLNARLLSAALSPRAAVPDRAWEPGGAAGAGLP